MGLPWVRLDTSMPDNPKVLGLLGEREGHRAAFVWLCCLTYAGKHGTDGFIPRNAAPFVHARGSDLSKLVETGLLNVVAGGWEIHGWSDFQESNDTTQARREKAQRAAQIRWSKEETAKNQRPRKVG